MISTLCLYLWCWKGSWWLFGSGCECQRERLWVWGRICRGDGFLGWGWLELRTDRTIWSGEVFRTGPFFVIFILFNCLSSIFLPPLNLLPLPFLLGLLPFILHHQHFLLQHPFIPLHHPLHLSSFTILQHRFYSQQVIFSNVDIQPLPCSSRLLQVRLTFILFPALQLLTNFGNFAKGR